MECQHCGTFAKRGRTMSNKRVDQAFRLRRIGNLYLCTAIVGTVTGSLILHDPTTAKHTIGILYRLSDQDPIVFGFVGVFWLSVALPSPFICGHAPKEIDIKGAFMCGSEMDDQYVGTVGSDERTE